MAKTHQFTFAAAIVFLTLAGAGCREVVQRAQEVTGPKMSNFSNASPKEATAKINFVPGSYIETRQTFLGFGAKLAALLAGKGKDGTRVIVINRFAPREIANVDWKLASKVEAESSIKAREEARRLKKPEPEPVMVESVSTGGVLGFNLKDAHSLMLPAYWPEKEDGSPFGSSGIWLSADAFDDLSRNRITTLDLGILVPELQGPIAKLSDFKNAFSSLQAQVTGIENRVDVKKMQGEAELIEWPLKVNGQDTKVEVIKAKSWFGEIIVLNNSQNPLVLKATLNPLTSGGANLISSVSLLQSLLGYEVTAIGDVQE